MNLNKVFLIGNLTQDPEMRSTQTGQTVTTLNMATNRAWTDKNGEKQTAAEFHRIVAWGRLGEIANQYLKKGGLVMIEGRIQTRSWTDQNNNKRYTTEIVAEGLQLGPRTISVGNTVSDIKPSISSPRFNQKQESKDDDIPIIDANDPISSGIEEDEVKIKEEDLPF
ncbi:MAG: single-stranded DNA-binding protein [Candidatus Yanofskybacteria bacterium]|nr:single-stranded DNA-binding protein [Candidatus Yanofskybacteria bacterium]